MADAAVEFLLENLKELLLYHVHLLSDAKPQVEKIVQDLRFLKGFLKESREKQWIPRELVREIRDVVYEAEDVIDTFVTQAAQSKSLIYFSRARPVKLLDIAKDVEKVSKKIMDIHDKKLDFSSFDVVDKYPQTFIQVPLVREENIVGFEDEAEKLMGYLTEETQQLDVISIIGMPGLGKTTLAGKIFRDPRIQYEFPTRIWVYISQEFTKKDLFLAILRDFTRLSDDMYKRSEQELIQLVSHHLENGKFLIVLDDVWSTEHWDMLAVALPKANKRGKVLITSRNANVARHANRFREPHNMRFITQEESWLLLRLEVFGRLECPPELEFFGKLIAKQCDGLPLALVVIGGFLVKTSTSEEIYAIRMWEKVSERVRKYLYMDPQGQVERVISRSYNKLPSYLKVCFIYFGMFPEDFEIPVSKLIQMWIAEGFIQQKINMSLEETAEHYLEDLIGRNLVVIDKFKANGRVKTCRMHGVLHEFCKDEAGFEKENFLQEMKYCKGVFEPTVSDIIKYRRLCIHSNIMEFISRKPYGPHVRSFVCFSREGINLPAEHYSSIPAAFKLLRVLDVKPIRFNKIPSDLFHLLHLKYIALSFNLAILPSAFSKLWNIQTLVVDTTCRTLEIKADIWKLRHLRCLKTNASTTLPKTNKTSKDGETLQTLGTISPHNCTEEVFERACNLKKLGIRGRLSMLLDGRIGSFDGLGKLYSLEKLKLLNDVFPSPPSEGQLRALPQHYQFPPRLRSLTLADTFLNWNQMSVLGLLESLEVLKLKDNAFVGKLWAAADGGFRRLEVLIIGHTDLFMWKASGHHFPRLRRLEVQNCEELREVPIGLADIPSLQVLKVHNSKLAAPSARKILEAKVKLSMYSESFNELRLSIFPPDESSPLTGV